MEQDYGNDFEGLVRNFERALRAPEYQRSPRG